MVTKALKVLAMDTAAPMGGVALLEGTRLLAKDHFQGPEGHVVLLPERLSHLLAHLPCRCADLDLVTVTIGPGSFSGLRIALAYAKGIALANQTPVIGISNLDLLAAGAHRQQGWVAVVMDARRGEVFAALYRIEEGIPYGYKEPGMAQPPEEWAATLAAMPALQNASVYLTGSGLEPYATLFKDALGTRFEVAPESTWAADPFVLGQLGQKAFLKQAQVVPTSLLEPIRVDRSTHLNYQRRPEAEVKKNEKDAHPAYDPR